MPPPKSIIGPKQLLVEGRDAEVFFHALLDHVGLADVQIQNFGGKDELPGFLKALRIAPDFARTVTSLGIVRDAETDPTAAFQSVCSALNGANLAVPAQVLVPAGHSPQVRILILPDAATPGMLETLCLQAVNNDPVIECIEQYFECVEQQTGSLPDNMHKARVQAFLASRPRPGLLVGQAAHAGYWHLDNPVFDHVRQFVQGL
jgi:hypothetical protein